MHRVLLNPTFCIETGELLSHDGMFHVEHFAIRCDRSIQKQAKSNASGANSTAGGFANQANQISSTIIPGLEQQATNPTGFTPIQKNNQLVAGAESVGGTNAGAAGEANLERLRTRTPGDFSAALDEAARIKGRQLSQNALQVENSDARLAQEKQQQAQNTLAGLYSGNQTNQLKAMGISDEDLNTALKAGQSGWLQQGLGIIGTIGGLGDAAANVKKAFT